MAPTQVPGTAPARPLPYQPTANAAVGTGVTLAFTNGGAAAVQMAVYSYTGLPAAPHVSMSGPVVRPAPSWPSTREPVPTTSPSTPPNGFLLQAAGDASTTATGAEAHLSLAGPEEHPVLTLEISNGGSKRITARVGGTRGGHGLELRPGQREEVVLDPVDTDHGWYDLTVTIDGHPTFKRRFAGHVNGRPSRTG